MSDLIQPQPLFEAHLVVWADGRATLADAKLDVYDERMDLIFRAGIEALAAWMQRYGRVPHAVIGDGGPEIVRLRARLYELRAELDGRVAP